MSIKLSRKPFEDIVKSYVIIAPESSIPSPGVQGRLFISNDTLKIFIDNGTQWVLVGELKGLSLASHGSRHAYNGEDPLPPNSILNDQIVSVDWNKIVNKPSTYPPSSHTHSRSDITDFWSTPFWDNIPDKPSTFPPSLHTHDASDIVSGVLSLDRIPTITSGKIADGAVTTPKIASGAVTPSRIGTLLSEGINAVNWFIATGLDIIHHENPNSDHTVTLLNKTLSDYSAIYISQDNMRMYHRSQYPTWNSSYTHEMRTANSTSDHYLVRWVTGSVTTLGYEAVDLSNYHYLYGIDISGSSFKCYRAWVTAKTISSATPKFTVTDTSFASGYTGIGFIRGYYPVPYAIPTWFTAFSKGVEAVAVMEFGVVGSGTPDDPYRPDFSIQLADILSLQGLPDFLYREAKKYQILRKRGFDDDEIQLLLGYKPQTQVNLDTVTWGAYEFYPDKSSTAVTTIFSDNPYNSGAIDRQKRKAKRVFKVSKNYSEIVELYNQLRRDYQYWLAGKDNFAYQVLGWEELDLFQNVDFYYGEFIDHKTHYQQLKMVSDWEIRNRLNGLFDKLSKVNVLTEERDKHINKVKEILKKGW